MSKYTISGTWESSFCVSRCHITFFEVPGLPADTTQKTKLELLTFPAGCSSLDGFLLKSPLPGVTGSWQGISAIATTPCFGTLDTINSWFTNVYCYNINFISSAFPSQIYLTQGLLVQSIPLLIPVVIELKCALKSHGWPAVPVDLWMPSSDSQIRRSGMAPECAWLASTPVVLMHAEKHWLVLWKLGCTLSLTKLPLPCQYPGVIWLILSPCQ